jgi:hypothetical protein
MFLGAATFSSLSTIMTLREAQAAWREAYGTKERLLWQTLADRALVYPVGEWAVIKVHEQLEA